jgi:hypothetical protein
VAAVARNGAESLHAAAHGTLLGNSGACARCRCRELLTVTNRELYFHTKDYAETQAAGGVLVLNRSAAPAVLAAIERGTAACRHAGAADRSSDRRSARAVTRAWR